MLSNHYYVHHQHSTYGWLSGSSWGEKEEAIAQAKALLVSNPKLKAVLVKDQNDLVVYDSRQEG